MNKVERKRIFFLFYLYKMCLEICYILAVSKVYEASGLIYAPNFYSFGISLVLTFCLAMTIPTNASKASTFWCFLFDFVSIMPVITLYWMADQSFKGVFLSCLFGVITHVIILKSSSKINIRLGIEGKEKIVIGLLFAVYLLMIVYLYLNSSGIHLNVFSFMSNKDIYIIRSEQSFSRLGGYIYNWVTKLLFCIFTVYAFVKKKTWMLVITTILQIIMFMCFGNKISLFSIIMLYGMAFLVKDNKNNHTYIVGVILCIAVLLVPLLNAFSATYKIGYFLNAQLGMRTLYVPAIIKFQYFDFFGNNEFLLLRETIFGRIFGISSPYGESIGLIITKFFDPNSNGNSNTGVIADAYANFGIIGIIVFAILTAYFIKMVDRCGHQIPLRFRVMLISIYAIYMNDNSLLITLLTNGLLLLYLFVPLFREDSSVYNLEG